MILRAFHHLLAQVRWHWWTDETVLPEFSLLLRAIGWLVQLLRIPSEAYRSKAIISVVAVSSQDLWVGILSLVLAVVVVAYTGGGLLRRAAASVAYIFWWGAMTTLMLRIDGMSLSIPDTAVSALLAFWIFIRVCRRIGSRRARKIAECDK